METITDRVRTADDTEFQRLIRPLQRAEEDVRERLARRRAALGGAHVPVSDPLYQRLFFILGGLTEQRVGAEDELSRRAGALAE